MPSELLMGLVSGAPPAPQPSQQNDDARIVSLFLRAVKAWALKVEDKLLKAYLATEPEGLRLFAIARTIGDERALLESLSLFSITLSDAGFELGVSVIPDGTPDELRAYLDPDAALALSWR